jgi:hypothetical protein
MLYPVISITSMSWMRLSLILVRSRVKPAPSSLRVSVPPPPSTRARLPAPVFSVAYNVYTYGDTNAELWIQERVTLRKMQCGFVVNGESKHDYSGWSVSSAGDVRFPAPVFSSAAMLLALMIIVSSPVPALRTSIPPLPFGKTDTGAIDLSKLGDKSKYTIDYLGTCTLKFKGVNTTTTINTSAVACAGFF